MADSSTKNTIDTQSSTHTLQKKYGPEILR